MDTACPHRDPRGTTPCLRAPLPAAEGRRAPLRRQRRMSGYASEETEEASGNYVTTGLTSQSCSAVAMSVSSHPSFPSTACPNADSDHRACSSMGGVQRGLKSRVSARVSVSTRDSMPLGGRLGRESPRSPILFDTGLGVRGSTLPRTAISIPHQPIGSATGGAAHLRASSRPRLPFRQSSERTCNGVRHRCGVGRGRRKACDPCPRHIRAVDSSKTAAPGTHRGGVLAAVGASRSPRRSSTTEKKYGILFFTGNPPPSVCLRIALLRSFTMERAS